MSNAWKARLRGLKAALSAEDFAALAYPTALSWGCLDLFDDVDDLPPQVLRIADAYPMHRCEWEDGNSAYSGPPVSRTVIDAGRIKVLALKEDDGDGRSWKAEMYAFLHQAVLFDGKLPQSHWIHGVVTDLAADQVTVALEGAEPAVRLHREHALAGPDRGVRQLHPRRTIGAGAGIQALVWPGGPSEEDPVIVYPRQSHQTEVVRQADAFWDGQDERYLEAEEEQEETRLLRFIRSRFPGEHTTVLHGLLADLDMRSYPGLYGGRFEVHVGQPEGGERPAIRVRLIEAPDPA